jgi:hypothetical protein
MNYSKSSTSVKSFVKAHHHTAWVLSIIALACFLVVIHEGDIAKLTVAAIFREAFTLIADVINDTVFHLGKE